MVYIFLMMLVTMRKMGATGDDDGPSGPNLEVIGIHFEDGRIFGRVPHSSEDHPNMFWGPSEFFLKVFGDQWAQ